MHGRASKILHSYFRSQRIATQRWIQGSFAFVFIDVFPPEHSLRNGFTAYT
jgi:hypothetical protein